MTVLKSHLTWYKISGINPEPWQASEGAIGRKNGKTYIHFHKPMQVRVYQESIRDEIIRQNPDLTLLDGTLEIVFLFWRHLAVSQTDDRRIHANIADATNLQKSTEDALQGILYKNDRSIRSITSIIVSQTSDTTPYILIGIGNHPQEDIVEAIVHQASTIEDVPEEHITILDHDTIKDVF